MLFNLTIFGIITDIPIEIDYKSDVLIDTTSFELPKVSGFEFEMPTSLLPISFNIDENEIEILTQLIERETVTLNVDSGADIFANEEYWLGNEMIRIDAVVSGTLTVTRGIHNTIANRYKRDDSAGIKLYLHKYPVWLTGKLLKIVNTEYEIIQYAVIESEPELEKGLLKFQCSDLMKTLETDLPQDYQKYPKSDKSFLSFLAGDLIQQGVLTGFSSYDYIPEFFSFVQVYDIFYKNDVINISTLMDYTKISSYKDLIELFLKLSKSILYQDKKTGYYELKALSPTLSFETNTEIKMLDYLDSTKDYKIKKQENIKKINVTYNDKKRNAKKITFNITNALFGKTLDIDLSAFENINYQAIFSMVSRYFYDTGFIYAVVEIPSSEIVSKVFELGQIYRFTDVLQYSFQNVTDYCMFLGSDGDVIKFAILKNYVRTLISPAIPVRVDAVDNNLFHFGWIGSEFSDFKLTDFLNIPSSENAENCENAVFQLNSTVIEYFLPDDFILLYDFATNTITQNKIVSINDNIIELTNSVTYPKNLWLMYDGCVNANDRQKKFFYLDINNY